MHVLHAIHDFLPRHQAGSELYALRLARAQSARHHVTMLCADFDVSQEHGQVAWRVHDGVPVVEIVNNWRCASFEETYRPPLVGARIRHALLTLRPDVLHVHNLLNLSFDLPAVAKALGIPVVATLHDYTLVCASGGQRVHRNEQHVCVDVDTERCARCFTESVFYDNATLGSLVNGSLSGRLISAAAVRARRMFPVLTVRAAQVARRAGRLPVTKSDMDARMAAARRVFSNVDLFVAPSPSLARDFVRFGLPAERLRVSDYGMPQWPAVNGRTPGRPLRIGLVGTLVWHKGAHVLVDALRALPATSYQATIFGSTDTFPAYATGVRTKAAGLPIAFAGAFAPGRAAAIYRDIDVLVVPSLWPENSPLVIHEAFQAGVAVVGARTGGIPDLIEDNVSGLLFEAGSPEDLARRLRELIENPVRVSALAAAAPRVKTIEQDATDWEDAYAEVIGRRVPMTRPRSAARQRRLAAVVLNYNTPDQTFLATRSLLLSRRPIDHVIVVDNGDGARCRSALTPLLDRITFIATDRNSGFSGGMNAGIRPALEAGADAVLLVNSDVVVPADCIESLERTLYERPGAGIAGPVVLTRSAPDRIASLGITYNSTTGRMRHRGVGDAAPSRPPSCDLVSAVSGCLMLVRREVFERIGMLEPAYFFSFEDLDFCLRAHDAGFSTLVAPAATALHEGGQSMGSDPRRLYFGARNHLWLAQRRGGPGGTPGSVLRSLFIVALNVAHGLCAPGGSVARRVSAVAAGTRDYVRGPLGQ